MDTGRLRRSIRVLDEDRGLYVVAETDYAIYVERGTRFTRAQPFMLPALRAARSRMLEAFVREMGRRLGVAVRGL